MVPVLMADACVLINLVASERLDEIAQANDVVFGLARLAANESLYTERPGDDGVEKVPIDIDALEATGHVRVLEFEPEEPETFLRMAAGLDDGEAATFAVASHRRLPVATDDRRALRYIHDEELDIEVLRTSTLVQRWAERSNPPPDEVREALRRIRDNASFEPGASDPNQEWWRATLEE
jgi:predicted nucleic acid-binding protein